MGNNIKPYISKAENIQWQGAPAQKGCFWDAVLNPMAPFAILWGCIDFSFIGGIAGGGLLSSGMGLFVIPFFALHLMPVWIYLFGIFKALKKDREAEYVITDKAIYIYDGTAIKSILFENIRTVTVQRGFIDKQAGTGDIIICSKDYKETLAIRNIDDYTETYRLIQDLQKGIQPDVENRQYIRTDKNNNLEEDYEPVYNTVTNKGLSKEDIKNSTASDFIKDEKESEKKSVFKEEDW